MFDIVLHAGTEHPNLVWVLVPSILSFVAGISLGAYSDRLRGALFPQKTTATE
jgi:hypothetical protein